MVKEGTPTCTQWGVMSAWSEAAEPRDGRNGHHGRWCLPLPWGTGRNQ